MIGLALRTSLHYDGDVTQRIPFPEPARNQDSAIHARARQAKETRAALVAAARRIFADKGYHAAGTHEIVAAANVTRGALQHHFPRKEDLFLAVFEQVQSDMIARASAGAGANDNVEIDRGTWPRLKADLIAYLEAATTPEVQRVVLTDGPAVLGWAEWRRLEAFYGLGIIIAGVEHGIRTGLIRPQPPVPLAHLILSVIDEAALMVANADDPVAAMRDAQIALDTMLSHLA